MTDAQWAELRDVEASPDLAPGVYRNALTLLLLEYDEITALTIAGLLSRLKKRSPKPLSAKVDGTEGAHWGGRTA